ncbi:MAG: rod-binding protein [Nitrospirota bacterium]|nr:rod-binding protein [Nitrospirota bacterium]
MIDPSILSIYSTVPRDQDNRTDAGNKTSEAETERVARKFESLFIYELLKGMRGMNGKGLFQGGLSGDVFQTLFDMELAKTLAERGTGISEMLMKSLRGNED